MGVLAMIKDAMTIEGFEVRVNYVCPVKKVVAHTNLILGLDTWHSHDNDGHIEPNNVFATFQCKKCGCWHNFTWGLHP